MSLQHAIGGGIGIFVAYIGICNVGLVNFSAGVPALSTLNQPVFWVFLIGLAVTVVLLILKVKGAILIGIVKICKGKVKEIHPILWVCTGLFILNFVLLALL